MIPSDCCRDSWGAYLYLAMGLYHVSRYLTIHLIFIITFIGIRSSAYTIGLGAYLYLTHSWSSSPFQYIFNTSHDRDEFLKTCSCRKIFFRETFRQYIPVSIFSSTIIIFITWKYWFYVLMCCC